MIANDNSNNESNKNKVTPNGKKKPSGGSRYGFKRATCPLCSGNIAEATGLAHHLQHSCPKKAGFIERLDTETNGGASSHV